MCIWVRKNETTFNQTINKDWDGMVPAAPRGISPMGGTNGQMGWPYFGLGWYGPPTCSPAAGLHNRRRHRPNCVS